GRYALAATARNRSAVKIHPEAAAGEAQQQYSYGLQYYPGADRAEGAGLITVQPGQEISSIDFRLPARPNLSIAGKIMVPPDAVSIKEVTVNIANEEFGNRMIMGASVSPPEYIFGLGELTS